MTNTVFYAWQSDTDESTNHHFIADALKCAIARLNADLDLTESQAEVFTLDRDTHDTPGMPPVAETLLSKIADASVFVADLTYVTSIGPRNKGLPNANVSIELGYAARAIGFERMICVFNAHYGTPDRLPFDLIHRRFPVQYKLGSAASADECRAELEKLSGALTIALRIIVQKLGIKSSVSIEELPKHAAAPLRECSFILNGQIAQTRARDDEGRDSEYIFWHHGPCAWIRIIPANSKNFSRSQLTRAVGTAVPPLRPFGDSARSALEANSHGVACIGYDDEVPPAIATQLTEVFRSGEMWGLNHSLIEPVRTQPSRTFQIPWPETQLLFQQTLAGYIEFAHHTLELQLPVTVVAGLAMVDQALFIPAKEQWFHGAQRSKPCLEPTVLHWTEMKEWEDSPAALLDPFFSKILDACGLDYEEWRTRKWPAAQ